MNNDKGLNKLLNATGFAFQLAVEAQVRKNMGSLNCQNIIREHPWFNPRHQASGFIDIVVEKGLGRFVLECKRTKNGAWVFLSPKPKGVNSIVAKCHWTCLLDETHSIQEWSEVGIVPECPESQFCSIRGTGEGKTAMLDRIGSELVVATEALGKEELSQQNHRAIPHLIYLPVIVTNAELYVGNFDPNSVDINTGLVEESEFSKVGAVRYKKALGYCVPNPGKALNLGESNAESERTVFVVNSGYLVEWLTKWDMLPEYHWSLFPWDQARKRFNEGKQ